ncbi:GNAT family N-acetyltransferase [Aquabacterium sp. OR-4]|uniref:GNAT family N-acetyltransferase n=1 Tax=Aquabacterium sp. OR-4 TaxID=2978127 RepID=UPI0021B31BA6|nr:GNAT family N-acetyltransferase [Aquabacterium sp. OR-4]MDT7838489.1 GNAT family N-acetyltransferase [Aquabacterium sp. OR-4]
MTPPSSSPLLRTAVPADAAACVLLRGQTRENAVSVERLRSLGITVDSWAQDIAEGRLWGVIAEGPAATMHGYCFGDCASGEVVVLALRPEAEGAGLGRALLQAVVQQLRGQGHARLFLGCASDPAVRSHGFYRHLGWRSTGRIDRLGDEELELLD